MAEQTRDWRDREFRVLVTIGEGTTPGGWSSGRERRWANVLAANVNAVHSVAVQMINVGSRGRSVRHHGGRP